MYNLVDYGSMLADSVRVEAYRQAIEQTVKGKRVLEIGGGNGFFACLASSMGASLVTSIEVNPVILNGMALARSNGLDNLQFVYGSSRNFHPSEPYDVIIHDLRGNTPFYSGSLSTIKDASRFLAPGGNFLPGRDRTYACLVEDYDSYARMEGVYRGVLGGLDLRALRQQVHRRIRYLPGPNAKPWKPLLIADVDYSSVSEEDADTTVRFCSDREGTSHGLVIWFETELTENIGYTTNPWSPEDTKGTTYGVVFLPWSTPVSVSQGEEYELEVNLDANGTVSCRLRKEFGGTTMTLGAFREARNSHTSSISRGDRFRPNEVLKAYRAALRGMEKGDRVSKVVNEVRESSEEALSEAAALRVVLRCADFTGVQVDKARSYRRRFRCHGLVFGLSTNSLELFNSVRDRLAPAWCCTRSKKPLSFEASVNEDLSETGSAYTVKGRDQRQTFDTLDETLDYVESLVLYEFVRVSGSLLLLTLPYEVEDNNEAWLILSEKIGDLKHPCLMDLEGYILTYQTAPSHENDTTKQPEPPERLKVRGVKGGDGLSEASRVALLMQNCANKTVLPDPVEFFSQLVKKAMH